MTDHTDSQLLNAYADRKLEPAFSELVRRHVDFVYSAAVRMVRDPQLAEDVTQGVFIALAKQAPDLVERTTLAGWLHRTAQNIAAQTVRTIERRRSREQEAVAMNEMLSTPDASWEQIEPHLDAALGGLSDVDRDAVCLRYFQKKSAAEIAAILGVSDEAAQKRVSRAVERLREFFAKRGITVGAGGLVVVISANAVQAAPVGLVATISTAALAGTAAATSTLIAATTKTIAMTTFQKTLVAAAVAVLAGVGIYEARQAAQLRDQVQTLQQQQAPLAEQIQQFQGELESASNRVAGMVEELANAKRNNTELLKLRGEITLLRRQVKTAEASVVKHQTMTSGTPAPASTKQPTTSDHPKETWSYAGYATPEDALQTWTWAMSKSDQQTMLNSLTPESRKQWEQIFASQPAAGVGIKGLGKIAGYKVVDTGFVSESEAWVAISMTEIKPTTTEPNVMKMILKKVGADWKVFGPSNN